MLRRARYAVIGGALISCCALLTGPAGAQMCVEPGAGMVGWWPGDGDSVDIHSGLHGVALNGTTYSPGLVGEAFDFDGFAGGQDDRLDLPPSALDGLGDTTIEMWMQTEADQGVFISGANDLQVYSDNEMLLFQGLEGVFVFVRQVHGGGLPFFVNDGVWHHLAFTRSGDIGTFYIDGVVVDSRTVSSEFFEIGPGGLILGQEQDCLGGCFQPEQAFDGLLDELSIYDRALTDAEILAIFEAGEAGKCKPVSMNELLLEMEEMEAEMEALRQSLEDWQAAVEPDDGDEEDCGHRHTRGHGHKKHHGHDGHDGWKKSHHDNHDGWKDHRKKKHDDHRNGHHYGRHDC